MLPWLLVLSSLQVPGDTVVVDVSDALARGIEVAPVLQAARHRSEAAARRSLQASRWPNPVLGVSVENLGQSERFTGISGAEGLDGQAVLTVPLPVGKERSGAIRVARAEEALARASVEVTELQLRTDLLTVMGAVLVRQVLVESAGIEAASLRDVAEALALQAEAGRAARGDADRARLAEGMAWTRLARREATLGTASAELARRLGYEAETIVRLDAPACSEVGSKREWVSASSGVLPLELRLAKARVEAAYGATEIARGVGLPDFSPQVGVRRTEGNTGLFVGLAAMLPLFDRGGERVDASIAEENVARAEQRDAEAHWAAALVSARSTLGALERAGTRFDEQWFQSLEGTVTAAAARYRLGEGTLVELLDARRARLQALDDYTLWQSEWWAARLEVARLEGRPATASTICTHPYREVP